jgi:NADPH:quinone reductase-like Zn-dependent oxidoreductase
VDAGELAFRAGKLRAISRARFPRGLGTDFTGRVAALGSGVHAWSVGEEVWGLMPHLTFGAIADHVTVPEQRLARAPKNLSLLDAAALPVSGTTAMTALTDKAGLISGERLLVRGATGGVGSIAVQLGKALGAHVTALAGARNPMVAMEVRTRSGSPNSAPTRPWTTARPVRRISATSR